MMCKRLAAALCALTLLVALLPRAARAEETHYAVIYDESDEDSLRTLSFLRRLMLYQNALCDYREMRAAADVASHDAVILCLGAESELPGEVARALLTSGSKLFVIGAGGLKQLSGAVWREGSVVISSGERDDSRDILTRERGLWMFPGKAEALGGQVYVDGTPYALCQSLGQVTHFAWFDASEDTLCALLATVLQKWLWIYENVPTAYGQYLVLDQVYPFMEPAALMEITDMLEEEGVPFAVTVMPLYSNAEYPAMKRFCEYLRYVQSRGAGIILRVPQVTVTQVEEENLRQHMKIAYQAYSGYGVYPLAVEAPESWLMTENGLKALGGYRTVFLYETAESLEETAQRENIAHADGHQLIAPAWQNQAAFTSAYAQAIYLDPSEDVETLRAFVKRLKSSPRVFRSLSGLENVVYVGDDYVLARDGGVWVNGKAADLRYTPFTYEADYTFDRGFAQYMTEQIETSNQYILIFVFVACSTFLLMILLSRRQTRQQLVRGRRRRRGEAKEAEKG